MTQKICDFCGKTESAYDKELAPGYMVTVQTEKADGWEWVMGKKRKFDMCTQCFESKIDKR